MERDFVGYGAESPAVRWPDGARIAVNLVVNYEEGSENRFEDGCARRETAGEVASQVPLDPPQRDLALPAQDRQFGVSPTHSTAARTYWRTITRATSSRRPIPEPGRSAAHCA